jgi:hypothetical protein
MILGVDSRKRLINMTWSEGQIASIETEADARFAYEHSDSLQTEFIEMSTFLAFWLASRSDQGKIFRGRNEVQALDTRALGRSARAMKNDGSYGRIV